ncbi:cytochrome c1 [Yunchengibacter salinarum]|uniref:cytochrome c1 n=1 Tax=Yunchengibacter salinarum TaxID=3133399 RepID=UPI0035B65CD1
MTAVVGLTTGVLAAGDAKHPKQLEWEMEGPFGTFDKASAQRGWQVYRNVCASCHSLKYFRFRNLKGIGYGDKMIEAFAAEYTVPGGPDEFGDPTTRDALPRDSFPSPYPNEQAARASNGGALPPDLSLMTKARHDGINYLYSLLSGYEEAPADVTLPVGKYYNPYFPGKAISMPAPLMEGIVTYEDGTEATVDQMARDVTTFLHYVAEPKMEDRKRTGIAVLLFLAVMVVLSYLSMKKIWKPVKEGRNVMDEE